MQAYTLYASVRPFGCSIILGGYDSRGPQLYMIEPSGISYVIINLNIFFLKKNLQGYYAIAVGKAKQAAKGELEKLKLSEMTCRQAIEEVAKM